MLAKDVKSRAIYTSLGASTYIQVHSRKIEQGRVTLLMSILYPEGYYAQQYISHVYDVDFQFYWIDITDKIV